MFGCLIKDHGFPLLSDQVSMPPAAEEDRCKKSPFSPNYDRKSSEETSGDADGSQSEEKSDENKDRARSSGRDRRRRERHARNARLGRDPSYSDRKRRARKEKAKAGEPRRRRRRRHTSGGADKRRRSASSDDRKRVSARASKSAAPEARRPHSPPDEPWHKGGTKPCPHCWSEVTLQQSGRLQHQWASKHCLAWQYWNSLDEKTRKEKSKAAWEQAKRSAAKLYEQRRYQAAPHQAQGDLPPAPPLVLRSRSSAAKGPPAAVPEDMEEILEEPPVRPTRLAPSGTSAVAVPVHAPQAASVPAGTSGSSAQSSTGKQQIVINING